MALGRGGEFAVVFSLRVAVSLVAVLCMVLFSGVPLARAASDKVFPSITVATPGVSGAQAIAALGSNLPAVADYYGMTADQLRNQLLGDSGLRLSGTGRLIYLSAGPRRTAAMRSAAATFAMSSNSLDALPLGQTFQLHSKPDALKTIYLNFQGATLSADEHFLVPLLDPGEMSIDVAPFSTDADPAFSDAERRLVQEIWQRVAEDFAPFDVDVTTEQPALDRISRASADDQVYGMDVLLTLLMENWNIPGSAGIGAPGAFSAVSPDADSMKPSLVFYTAGAINARTLADAATREVGITLGLRTDVQGCNGEPYAGQGDSEVNGWAPIMGELSERPLRQFDKGEYADPGICGEGAVPPQDDFIVMQGAGLLLRADEAGNTTGTASWLPVTSSAGRSAASFGGVIASADDTDVFYLDAGAGVLDITVEPAPLGPNADLELTLRNSAGNVVQVSKPIQNLGAAINVSVVAPGRYFLEVKGGGEGDPLLTGYSNYGSVGAYELAGSFATPSNAPPSAVMDVSRVTGSGAVTFGFDAARSGDDGSIMLYRWDFGDGTWLEATTPGPVQKSYPSGSAGVFYTISLTVTDNSGLTATATRSISPGAAPPSANITADVLTGPAPLAVAFNPSGSTSDDGITSYAWNFGDGTTRVNTSPVVASKTYTTAGTYPVSLQIIDGTGRTATATVTIVVTAPVAPVASFTSSHSSGAAPLAVTFDPAASRDDVQIVSYRWDFGGGDVRTTGTAASVSKTFNTPGSYTVSLQVTDNAGLTATASRTITVNAPANVAPVASFTSSHSSGAAPLAVTFDPAASRDDVQIVSYRWDFGGGDVRTTGTAASVSKTFNTPGSYTVSLQVTDNAGLTATASRTITVTEAETVQSPPVAAFSASQSAGFAPLAVTFDPAASHDDGQIVSYRWDFGDGEVRTESTSASVSKAFGTPGTYTVILEVTDDAGLSATTTTTVTVMEAEMEQDPPVAAFSSSQNGGVAPLAVTFDPAASHDDGQIVSYLWNFGDGDERTEATAASVSKTFSTPGTYTVTLQVTDDAGLNATASRIITVTEPETVQDPPVAAFSASQGSGVAPLAVTFDPAASHDDRQIVSYRWDFGDGEVRMESTAASVSKTFGTPGTYGVILQVTDDAGLTATASRTITVMAPPLTADPHVSGIEVKLARGARGRVKGRATVAVVDSSGRPAAGATVIAQWLHPVRGVSSGRTRSNGKVDLTSPSTAVTGCLRLNVVAVRVGGRLYRADPPVPAEVCRP